MSKKCSIRVDPEIADTKVSFRVTDLPLEDVLHMLARSVKGEVKYNGKVIDIVPADTTAVPTKEKPLNQKKE